MSGYLKRAIFWAVVILVVVLLWTVVRQDPGPPTPTITWSRFSSEAKDGNIAEITVAPDDLIIGRFKNGATFKTVAAPFYRDTVERLMQQGVSVRFLQKNPQAWSSILINAIPFVLLLGFWLFMMRQLSKAKKAAPTT